MRGVYQRSTEHREALDRAREISIEIARLAKERKVPKGLQYTLADEARAIVAARR